MIYINYTDSTDAHHDRMTPPDPILVRNMSDEELLQEWHSILPLFEPGVDARRSDQLVGELLRRDLDF